MDEETTVATETPVTTPEATSALPEPAASDAVNWEGVAEEILTDEAGATVEGDLEVGDNGEAPEGFAKSEVEPVEPPTVTAPAAAEPVAVAPATPVEPAKVEPVKAEPQAPFDAAAWEKEQLTGLEQLYQLPEEEQTALLTEPEKVLPKLAASIHFKVTQAVLHAVQGSLPQIIQQQQNAISAETTAKNAFYEANPDLADPAYESAIIQVGQMFRKMNPTASREEAMKRIGELVRVSMGLPPGQAVTQQASGEAQPAAPRPFVPARGGAGAGVPAAQETNIWTALANEMD